MTRLAIIPLLAAAAVLPGCLQRTLSITTEPPGALVWVNDVEVGTTPLETDFTYYGGYDVRIRRPGYEPIATKETIDAPIQELPVIDFFAEMWPSKIENRVEWKYTLVRAAGQGDGAGGVEAERAVIERGKALRDQLKGPEQPSPEPTEKRD